MLHLRRLTTSSSSRGAIARVIHQSPARFSSTLVGQRDNLGSARDRLSETSAFSRQHCRSKSTIPGLSSLSEPGLNLFPSVALGDAAPGKVPEKKPLPETISPEVRDAQLRADIRAMGRMLGQVIQMYEGEGRFCWEC